MAQKYTILKAITRTSNKGFTLLELLIGMIITLIIGGLAMQAFINASATFSKDKKSIESDQNLSAVLEIIGNDIRQAGENISESPANFPVIEFITNTDTDSMSGSSKITIRRGLSEQLTLCADLDLVTSTPPTTIPVADTTKDNANCKVTQLLRSRSTATSASIFDPLPITAATPTLTPLLPGALRKARDYRCQIPDPNGDYTSGTTEFCNSSTPKVKVAVSDTKGHMFILNQTAETVDSSPTANDVNPISYDGTVFQKYSITVDTAFEAGDPATLRNTYNKVKYLIGNPIYLIEERIYTLNNKGDLQVSIDGKPPSTLIKKITKFRISARIYGDAVAKTINNSPADSCVTDTSAPLNTQFSADSTYTCKFNGRVGTALVPTPPATTPADPVYNWKTLAGVKIQVQGQYDGRGQNATPTQTDLDKITAASEFFPRNVLSK
jgi:prepilin-type N-terminal cleavage/methylation domain-containing protein